LYVYSNNGLAFRAWNDPATLAPGELYFDHAPSGAELLAAFPAYTAAQAAQQALGEAAALLASGLAITSTGTPAVNGTYSCAEDQQTIITRVQAYITKNAVFPGGMSTLQLRTVSGGLISVPSVALFQAIGSAIADFVAKVDEAELAALAGGGWVAPSNSVTIA
jgi:hypothetical protein